MFLVLKSTIDLSKEKQIRVEGCKMLIDQLKAFENFINDDSNKLLRHAKLLQQMTRNIKRAYYYFSQDALQSGTSLLIRIANRAHENAKLLGEVDRFFRAYNVDDRSSFFHNFIFPMREFTLSSPKILGTLSQRIFDDVKELRNSERFEREKVFLFPPFEHQLADIRPDVFRPPNVNTAIEKTVDIEEQPEPEVSSPVFFAKDPKSKSSKIPPVPNDNKEKNKEKKRSRGCCLQ